LKVFFNEKEIPDEPPKYKKSEKALGSAFDVSVAVSALEVAVMKVAEF
jgi:hypothetical protein